MVREKMPININFFFLLMTFCRDYDVLTRRKKAESFFFCPKLWISVKRENIFRMEISRQASVVSFELRNHDLGKILMLYFWVSVWTFSSLLSYFLLFFITPFLWKWLCDIWAYGWAIANVILFHLINR